MAGGEGNQVLARGEDWTALAPFIRCTRCLRRWKPLLLDSVLVHMGRALGNSDYMAVAFREREAVGHTARRPIRPTDFHFLKNGHPIRGGRLLGQEALGSDESGNQLERYMRERLRPLRATSDVTA